MKWQDKFLLAHRPFEYRVGFTLADNITEITKFDNPDGQIDQFYKGKRLGEIWGYTVEGFFQTDTEYLDHADQTKVNRRIQRNYLINHPVAEISNSKTWMEMKKYLRATRPCPIPATYASSVTHLPDTPVL